MMKKLYVFVLSLITASTVFIAGNMTTVHAETPITIKIDGEVKMPADALPEIVTDRVFVPLRFVSEQMGHVVDWDRTTNSVSIDGGLITHVIGTTRFDSKRLPDGWFYDTTTAHIDKNNRILPKSGVPIPTYIKDDRTMVPFRIVAAALGCIVDWDGNTRTVIITTTNQDLSKPVVFNEADDPMLPDTIEVQNDPSKSFLMSIYTNISNRNMAHDYWYTCEITTNSNLDIQENLKGFKNYIEANKPYMDAIKLGHVDAEYFVPHSDGISYMTLIPQGDKFYAKITITDLTAQVSKVYNYTYLFQRG